MKQIFIRITICFAALFLSCNSIHAQQFKWVKGGGTSQDLTSTYLDEATYNMCTDPNGNVYALSVVGNNPIIADTFYRASGAYGAENNILITSYNCNGQMRWAKLLASSGATCAPYGIASDVLGNIYVAGQFPGSGGIFYIGYDTLILPPSSNYLSTGLIRFDTSGNFKWIRFVGANTFASEIATASLEDPVSIDGANNVHYFCYMKSGVPLMASVTSTYGVYDMTYNTAGTLLSAVRLDMDSAWFLHQAIIDPATNKLYAYGEINQSIYGSFVPDTFYAAAFDASRDLLWQYYTGNDTQASDLSGMVLDQSKHLHFSGAAATYFIGIPSTFSFNGVSVSNTDYPNYALGVILTTDTNGHPEWVKKFDGSLSVNGFNALTQLSNNKVAALGTFAGHITDGTVSLSTPPTEGWSPYIVVIDSGGDLQTIQQIHGDGFYNAGFVIASDNVGNIYLGGQAADSIWAGVPSIPAYHTVGGNTDFFVMKYGVDCSCTSAPIATYTDTGTHTIGLTYTGTSTGIDSIVWNFGDGSATVTGATAIHTYSVADTYRVCVTVYAECGSDIHCSDVTVMIPTESSIAPSMPNVKVYPNPANDELNITGLQENAGYRLFSVTGINLLQGVLQRGNSTISMKDFAGGIYILEMVGNNGEKNMVRIIKE